MNPTSWKCYCCAAHSLVISSEALTAAFICWSLLSRSALWLASEALSLSLFPCHTHLQACSNRQAKFKLDTPTYVAMSLLYPALALLQPFLHFPRSSPRLSDSYCGHAKIHCGLEHDHNEDRHEKDDHKRSLVAHLWFGIEAASSKLLHGNTCQAVEQVDCIHCSVTP